MQSTIEPLHAFSKGLYEALLDMKTEIENGEARYQVLVDEFIDLRLEVERLRLTVEEEKRGDYHPTPTTDDEREEGFYPQGWTPTYGGGRLPAKVAWGLQIGPTETDQTVMRGHGEPRVSSSRIHVAKLVRKQSW